MIIIATIIVHQLHTIIIVTVVNELEALLKYNNNHSQFSSPGTGIPLDAGIGSMIMTVVKLVEPKHPVCTIIYSTVS